MGSMMEKALNIMYLRIGPADDQSATHTLASRQWSGKAGISKASAASLSILSGTSASICSSHNVKE